VFDFDNTKVECYGVRGKVENGEKMVEMRNEKLEMRNEKVNTLFDLISF
jgi:hypothetical protein